jgi:hypothetical protein
VAALVQQSAIREHLLTALDDWAEAARSRGSFPDSGRDKELSQKLQAITRQLDPDPWRNRLRDAMVSREAGELEQLARSAPVEELPATTLDRLGRRFNQMQLKPMPEPMLALLRRAQQRFPDDLWINYNLALAVSRSPQVEVRQEAIGFFRVVVALRPQDNELLSEVAAVFSDVGKLAEAEAAYRNALELSPGQAWPPQPSVTSCSSKGSWPTPRRPTATPSSSTPMRTMRTTTSASRCTAGTATRRRRPNSARP